MGMAFEAVEKLTFFEQPLDRNHAFDRIPKKNRALQAHFFFPCINSEIHALGIYEFAPQILFYACCRTKYESQNAAFLTDWKAIPAGMAVIFCSSERKMPFSENSSCQPVRFTI